MRIKAIEPTPSPNTMKILLTEELPAGKRNNFKADNKEESPPLIRSILEIDGVRGVYHVADFLAVERNAKFDWKDILPRVREAFGEETGESSEGQKVTDHFGEINTFVQIFKGIPMQVKLTDGTEEKRFGLPAPFLKALSMAQQPEDNVVMLRKWKELGTRYGEMDQLGPTIVEEIVAAYPEERLNRLVDIANNPEKFKNAEKRRENIKVTVSDLDHPDWKVRYQLLEQMADPSLEDLPMLERALSDEKASIRRLATVYLGMIEDKRVLPLLYRALKDSTVTVRRTAGDCLSDLGYKEAMDAMVEALKDKSKLVRWRAAMFLYEVGDEKALPGLKAAEKDPEFEVSMQIGLAIERIEGGEAAKGSIWKQMTEARKQME